ncbi:MAG: glycosyltransferase family 4 protein [Thermoleophilia bacterium]
MKILQVAANSGYGGMPFHVLTLSKGLKERGHEVELLSLDEGPLLDEFIRAGIPVTSVPFLGRRTRRDPVTLLKSAGLVRKTIHGKNPDIVHTHGPRAHFFVDMAQLFTNGPAVVSSVHGSYSQFISGNRGEFGYAASTLKKMQYGGIDKFTARRSAMIIAVCEATRRELIQSLKIAPDKVRVVSNGIEERRVEPQAVEALRREFGCGDNEKLVAYVGRIAFHKGTGLLAEAAEIVAADMPEARFVAVGEGPMVEGLRSRTAAGPLAGRFIVAGRRRDAVDVIAASDLLILPSLSEGLPLTLLEAAMTGTAMVASDTGGIPEIVIEGETGLLVPVGDRRRLAAAIERLLADDQERVSMGAAARRLWERRFTVPRMIDGVEEIYLKVAEQNDTEHPLMSTAGCFFKK